MELLAPVTNAFTVYRRPPIRAAATDLVVGFDATPSAADEGAGKLRHRLPERTS